MKIKMSAAILTLLFSTSAFSLDAVIDVANLTKNAVTAIQAQHQTQLQIQQLMQQINMYRNFVENSQKLPDFKLSQQLLGRIPGSPVAAIDAANYTAQRLLQLMQNIENIKRAQQGILDTSLSLDRLAITSGLSAEQIIDQDAKRRDAVRQNSQNFLNAYQGFAKEIETNQSRNDEITSQLSNSIGVHQTLQTMGLQNRLVADQINQLVMIQTTAAQQASQRELADQGMEDLRKKRRAEFLKMRDERIKRSTNAEY